MLREQADRLAKKAAMFTRVIARTGIWKGVTPKGLYGSVRSLALGGSGPSAIFRIHGRNTPTRVAFEFQGRSLTYGAVDRRINAVRSGLAARGFRKGDTALSLLKNSPEVLVLGSALSRLGASAVAASWRSTVHELEYLVTHSGASAIFFEAELAANVAELCKRLGLSTARAFAVNGEADGFMSVDSLLDFDATSDAVEQEGAVIIYTSGTTGRPKGAVRRFATGQIEGFFAFIHETPMTVDDRHLAVCPLYHSTGLGFAGMTLMLGGTVVVEREFDPAQFLQQISRDNITTTAIVPTMLHRLMGLPEDVFYRSDTRSLKAMFCGGAQLPGPLATTTLRRLGPVLYNFYGATETGLVCIATPQELAAAPGTIGHAVPGTEIRLLDDKGSVVPPGAVGELYARNSMLVAGYHDDDESTNRSLKEGFFSVGDLAMQDSEGRFHICGRKRDMVISGGVNIYPVEVEETIAEHRGVAQVAVIGVPDGEWGERLRAFVVRREAARCDAAELKAWVRARLSGPKVPKEWAFVDSLPSNPTGKILKRELKDYTGVIETA
jgi:fatty-acyl-CoA synthase